MSKMNVKFRIYQPVEACFTTLFSNFLPFTQIKRTADRNIFIPYYHLISDKEKIPHTQWLFHHRNSTQFEDDIDFFLKHFKPLTLDKLLESIQSRRSIEEPSFIITFDDGYREAYEIAAPILEKKGLEAIFFLTTDFLDNRRISARHQVSIVLSAIQNNGNNSDRLSAVLKRYGSNRRHPKDQLMSLAKENENVLPEIAGFLGIRFDDYLDEKKPFMTENEVKDLKRRGFALGAHSISHPKYAEISLEEQKRQTLASVEVIKNTFSVDYRLFSFPFSDYRVTATFYDHLKDDVDIFFGTSGFMVDDIGASIQRFPMENDRTNAQRILKKLVMKKYLRTLAGINAIKRLQPKCQ